MKQIKHVFIVRHGHADFGAKSDFQRVLNSKGKSAVKKTASFIKKQCEKYAINLESCICSAALRTKQTTEIIHHTNTINNTTYHQELYSTVGSKWLDKIIESPANTLLIVGHNPTFSQLINNLCGYNLYMKPANCAFITLEIQSDGIIYPATLNEFHHNEQL
jgi:phosphohistidine phosphatase